MKLIGYYTVTVCGLLLLLLMGCEKNESHYYADNDYPGAAVFSNKGYNVMSCFINGSPWKTIARRVDIYGRYTTELEIRRIKTNSLLDTVSITWRGNENNINQYNIILTLPVVKNFQWKDFSSFEGKRITIDSTNGYFSFSQAFNINPTFSGKGVIYFNKANIDSTGPGNVTGRISGLLQSGFGSGTIFSLNLTSGRFDDNISSSEIRNY